MLPGATARDAGDGVAYGTGRTSVKQRERRRSNRTARQSRRWKSLPRARHGLTEVHGRTGCRVCFVCLLSVECSCFISLVSLLTWRYFCYCLSSWRHPDVLYSYSYNASFTLLPLYPHYRGSFFAFPGSFRSHYVF